MSLSDSDASNVSPPPTSHCFCGRQVVSNDGSIYCSLTCARSDAFESLCYKPTPVHPQSYPFSSSDASSSSSAQLSRNPSTTSTTSTQSALDNGDEWNASHYRRLAHADIRKEERKSERRKRRGDPSSRSISGSISSTFSRDVPELVGGHGRNPSIASSISSTYTVGTLSRNPSSASTSSRFGARPHIDTAIMEDEDEEWLMGSQPIPRISRKPKRRGSNAVLTDEKMKAFGMGKDMRDVLEEIIQMEKGFSLSDTEDQSDIQPPSANPGIFTAMFDRPPRTPSPSAEKRQSRMPNAPGAPARGHRVSMSFQPPPGQTTSTPRYMPQNVMGHQSSLSESHTALYLATASPAGPGRRSISPRLAARKSLTFTPDKAGPSIGALRGHRFDSPSGATPQRRRGNISPGAFHPTMDGWKFPTASNAATPTRPPPIDTTNIPGNFSTPTGLRLDTSNIDMNPLPREDNSRQLSPQLLWPPSSMPPPLAPALFPCSPALNTPEYMSSHGHGQTLPPHSGLRLGVLLGSGDDVEMDADETENGYSMIGQSMGSAFLPVYLQQGYRWD